MSSGEPPGRGREPGSAPERMPELAIIAAMDRNRLIGVGGGLPWRLPADLRRFRELTLGHPVVMGRITHQSIGRPLPGRRNLVVTRHRERVLPGCEQAGSLGDALSQLQGATRAFVIGGSRLYREALPIARRMYLTLIDAEFRGDAWFPSWDTALWQVQARVPHPPGSDDAPWAFEFVDLVRAPVPGAAQGTL